MSDLLPEDVWVNVFLHAPPRPLLTALQRRQQASQTHVSALSELFKQRAAIETQYADSLAKLARSAEQGNLLGKGSVEWDRGGAEAKIWESVTKELSETSTSHSTLAAMVRTDFEQPIRDLPNKISAWRKISDQESSLDKTLKEYEKTSAKLEKAAGKSKSSKADMLSGELNQLTASLASLSPMVYTTFQRLDEERLKALKEIIVRWGTLKGDVAARDGERAEAAVAAMFSWEAADEVLTAGQRLSGSNAGRSAAPPSSAVVSTRSSKSQRTSSPTASDFSPRPSPRPNGGSREPSSQGAMSFTGGFKSMLGRSKTIATRGRSDSYATSVRSAHDRDATVSDSHVDAPSAQVSSLDAIHAEWQPQSAVDSEGYSIAPVDRHRSPWDEPDIGPSMPVLEPTSASTQPMGNSANATGESGFASLQGLSTEDEPGQPKLNLALSTKPIEETEADRQAALEKVQRTLGLPAQQPARRTTIARGRRDVRNTMFGGDSLLPASEGGAGSAGTMLSDGPGLLRQESLNSVTSNNPFDSPGPSVSTSDAFSNHITGTQGLSAALTESVSVIMRNGAVQKLQVNGEIRIRSSVARSAPVHIRLLDFEQLEKIAPNPAFLSQVPDKPGEYLLNTSVLVETGSLGALLFKYQVHTTARGDHLATPLSLDPAFQCKGGETRMILKYAADRTLTDVVISAMFGEGPAVSNVQAKPAGGTWSPPHRTMTWNLGQMSQGDGKIIAKFASEADGVLTPVSIQAAWSTDGATVSGLGIDVLDGSMEIAEVKRVLTAGKYIAEPTVKVE